MQKYVFRHVKFDEATAAVLSAQGWEFDWSKDTYKYVGSEKVAAYLDDELQGIVEYEVMPNEIFDYVHLIEISPKNRGENRQNSDVAGCLFEYVARDSLEAGFDGFVVFESKTELYNHYIDKYGAIPSKDRYLYFDTNASLNLIKTYLQEAGDVR